MTEWQLSPNKWDWLKWWPKYDSWADVFMNGKQEFLVIDHYLFIGPLQFRWTTTRFGNECE